MLIELVGEKNEKVCFLNVLIEQFLRIQEPDIEFISTFEPKFEADITYWLHAGMMFMLRRQSKKINLTYFYHPKKYWEYVMQNSQHCVFQSKRYYDMFDIPNKSLISPGIYLDIFKPNFKIGIVAINRPRKNSDFLLKFFKTAKLDNFTFCFCGTDWENEIKEYRQFVKVEYKEKIPQEEIPQFYQSIDYLLITSTMEGGPMPLLEAMACGKTVITTDVGYVGEVRPIVYKDLSELIKIFEAIGKNNSTQVLKYSWENFRDKHVELFRKLVNENR